MIYNQVFFLLFCVVFCTGDQFEDDCGLEEVSSIPLVRGGNVVKANQFPWHVAIFEKEHNQFELLCGGSLIRSNMVITAAHCFSLQSHNHQINVTNYRVVGGIHLASWTSTEKGRQQSEVIAVRLGEQYGASIRNWQDDIAIVQLLTAFTFSDTVRAVCLDLVDTDLHNRHISPSNVGKVAGWGLTESETPSEMLKFLFIPVVGVDECIQRLPSGYKSYYTSDKICAGLINGSAVCPGDSGGGLVFPVQSTRESPPRWYLRGVLSNAPSSNNLHIRCLPNVFAFYSNVLTHKIWLLKTMDSFQALAPNACRIGEAVGICKNDTDCLTAEDDIYIFPQVCLPGPEICCEEEPCPPISSSIVTQRKTGSKANDFCVDLPEKLFPCEKGNLGWRRGDICGKQPDQRFILHRMVYSTAQDTDDQRYYVLLKEAGPDWAMTVALVSERWLLAKASEWKTLLKSPSYNLTKLPKLNFTISRTVYDPQYLLKNNTEAEGIVLLEIEKPVTFNIRLLPVCLPPEDPLSLNSGGITLNWLYKMSGTLSQHSAELLPQAECDRLFPADSIESVPDGGTNQSICATSIFDEECMGFKMYDLTTNNIYRVPCTRILLGLYWNEKSDGGKCKYLFLRLASFVPWVESVVWP